MKTALIIAALLMSTKVAATEEHHKFEAYGSRMVVWTKSVCIDGHKFAMAAEFDSIQLVQMKTEVCSHIECYTKYMRCE